MEENTEQGAKTPSPGAGEGRDGGEDPKDPKVPPASETWVEGQPTSDADYGGDEKAGE